jgi:hypothetical protein
MNKSDHPESTDNPQANAPAEPLNHARRRLSKAALASPVVASLMMRPAFGATEACSISGFMSGNTSPRPGGYTCEGYGCTPGFWKTQPEIWSAVTNGTVSGGRLETYDPCDKPNLNQCKYWSSTGGTTLASVLGGFNPFGVDASKPLLDLLNENNGQPVFHFIGAFLNATASPISFGSTAEEVIEGLIKAASLGKVHDYGQLLDKLNNRGCMFDAHGNCADEGALRFVWSPTYSQCIPQCPNGKEFDPISMSCVLV